MQDAPPFRSLYQDSVQGLDDHFLVRYQVVPADGLELTEVARRLLLIVTQRTLTRAGIEPPVDRLGVIVGHPTFVSGQSWATVRLALPAWVARPHEGISQLMLALTAPVEYGYTKKLWVDGVDLPEWYVDGFSGPRFGVSGVRDLFGVPDRPLLGLVVKPRVGVSAAEVLKRCEAALEGGVDFLVDDLLLGNPDGEFSLRDRVARFATLCGSMENRTKKRKLYFAHVAGTPIRALRDAVAAVRLGADGLLLNGFLAGIDLVEDLTRMLDKMDLSVPVIVSNMGSGIASRVPTPDETQSPPSLAGMSEAVIARLSRLVGADAVHTGTSQSECYEVAWNDAVTALHSPLAGTESGLAPSFRVAEGDLQAAGLWKNIYELSDHTGPTRADVLFELTNAIHGFTDGTGAPSALSGARVYSSLISALWNARDAKEARKASEQLATGDREVRNYLDRIRFFKEFNP